MSPALKYSGSKFVTRYVCKWTLTLTLFSNLLYSVNRIMHKFSFEHNFDTSLHACTLFRVFHSISGYILHKFLYFPYSGNICFWKDDMIIKPFLQCLSVAPIKTKSDSCPFFNVAWYSTILAMYFSSQKHSFLYQQLQRDSLIFTF